MATLIRTDGTEQNIQPSNAAEGFHFEGELYRLLQCDTIQIVQLADGRLMLMDEEAKLRRPQKLVNWKATQLMHEAGGSPFDVVLGDVVIAVSDELK